MRIITDKGDFDIPKDEKPLNMTVVDKDTILVGTTGGLWRIEDGKCEKIIATDWIIEADKYIDLLKEK